MDIRLERFAADNDGVFTRAMVLEIGSTDLAIGANVQRGIWRRVRDDVYIETSRWKQLDASGRRKARARADRLRRKADRAGGR